MQMDERILAEGCREGDGAARRELYDRFAGRLMAVCMRYAGDRATAEDLLHDAFLKIYGAFGKFSYRGPGSLRAWMERVTVNVVLEWLRGRNRLGMTELDEGRVAATVAEPAVSDVEQVPREVLLRCIASRSIPTAKSPGCWESTRRAPRRNCFAPGRCWPARSGLIWSRIEVWNEIESGRMPCGARSGMPRPRLPQGAGNGWSGSWQLHRRGLRPPLRRGPHGGSIGRGLPPQPPSC